MPKIRINFPDELSLKNEQVGIGTNDPTARLDVRGNILADNSVGGDNISTITRYDGFLNETQTLYHNLSVSQDSKGNLNSLSGEIVINGEVTVSDDTPLTGGRLDSLTVTGKFDLPHGGSEDREDTPEKGSTRFNQDLGQLEFYTGYEWRTVNSYADGGGRGRGVFGGGSVPGNTSVIDFINIQNLGNAVNFGNLTVARRGIGGCSSSIRGLFGGGDDPTGNTIDYITIAAEGNAIDFGDLTHSDVHVGSLSSSTRGIWAGGVGPANVDIIDYVEISTLGNALDFGNLMEPNHAPSGVSNGVRGVFCGGNTAQPFHASGTTDRMQFITISSTGDTVDFGNLTQFRGYINASSNSVRGICANGYTTPTFSRTIDYLTIATTGNAIDFGETSQYSYGTQGCATQTRAIVAVGSQIAPTTRINVIEYVEIATTGNSVDFGDLTLARSVLGALSDSHGGLGGF